MAERYWLTFATRHRHGPPTQEPVYYQREGDRWRLYYGKTGRRRAVGTDSPSMVAWQVDLAKSEGRFLRHEPDQGRLFNPLVRGYSRAAISANVSREMHAGRDQDQAVAIALETARRAFRRRHPRGRAPDYLRRNPTMPSTRSNPGKAARARRREARAAHRADIRESTEYTRMVRALPPDPTRLGRLEQSYELDKRLGRLQRRGVKETRIGRVTYRLNPARETAAARDARERAELEAYKASPDYRAMMRRREQFMTAGPYGRQRRRRRNPDRGEWIDLLVPLVVLFLLIRSGRVQVGG